MDDLNNNWLELDVFCLYCGTEEEIGMTQDEYGLFGPRSCSTCGETKNLKITRKVDGIDYYRE